MKAVLLALMVAFSLVTNAQSSKFKSEYAEVTDASGKIVNISCGCEFIYTPTNFFMNCKNPLVYYFLLPGSEFMDLRIVGFYDTGYIVNMSDTIGTATPSLAAVDSSQTSNIGVVYETYDAYRKMQFIQVADETSITLIKRDKTKIKFK